MIYKIAQENLEKEAGLLQFGKNLLGKLKGAKKQVAKTKTFVNDGVANQQRLYNQTLKQQKTQLEQANKKIQAELSKTRDELYTHKNIATEAENKAKNYRRLAIGGTAVGTVGTAAGIYGLTRNNNKQEN